jgi:hydroxyacylglutathione hydrolase
MQIFKDFYVYPWLSHRENNCNTIFIDGPTPLLVDPGHLHLFSHVVEGMARDGKVADQVRLIICTHSHSDHIEAADQFDQSVFRAISKIECDYLQASGKDLGFITGYPMPNTQFTVLLKEGSLTVGDKTFKIILTPGHSPGAICLYWEEPKVLISGDTVFYMGVGRTDFPGGDINRLGESVERLAGLDIEYLVPGHGEILQGRERIKKNFALILGEFF